MPRFSLEKFADRIAKSAERINRDHIVPAAKKLDKEIERAAPKARANMAQVASVISRQSQKLSEFAQEQAGKLNDQPRLRVGEAKKTIDASWHPTSRPATVGEKPSAIHVVDGYQTKHGSVTNGPNKTLCKQEHCSKPSVSDKGFCDTHLIEYGAYRQRKCGKKERHRNREAAEKHLDQLEQQDWRSRGAFNVYECEFCDCFHVGHSKKSEQEF